MKNIKIPEGEVAEQTIRNHALATFNGCRELRYEVSTPTFDEIWMRTQVPIGRGTAKPRLLLIRGRHHITVLADDEVPGGEVRLADDEVPGGEVWLGQLVVQAVDPTTHAVTVDAPIRSAIAAALDTTCECPDTVYRVEPER